MSAPSRIAKILVSAVDSNGNLGPFCRLAARELSASLKPKLDAYNIRFIGIGFDEKFLKPFVDGKFFAGELYVDANKECYNALQYHRFGYLDLVKLLFSAKWREAIVRAKNGNIEGDMKGDGFQNGGALVVDRKGKLLLEYRQEDAADHVKESDVLNALRIQ